MYNEHGPSLGGVHNVCSKMISMLRLPQPPGNRRYTKKIRIPFLLEKEHFYGIYVIESWPYEKHNKTDFHVTHLVNVNI